ncbi:MAG: hypothetical protein KDI19_17030, partial [Pseudomonadales bacterium]|nr:hypothetical protein [Pseudomonadales bacterium]
MKYLLLGLALAAAHPGHAQETVSKPTNYVAVAAAINETMAAWHYDPAELAGEAYLIARSDLDEVALKAKTDDEFLAGFREIWAHGPFSHVELNRARGTAADLSNYLDNLRVGENGAMLSWQGDMA